MEIRQCTMADLPYIYEICYLTGYNGGSVEGVCSDKFKTGHYFAAPYLHYNLQMCFVVTADNIPRGYILGTDNTEDYTHWLNDQWLPEVRKLYDFTESENTHDFEKFLNSVIAENTVINEKLRDFPAHLHIDLLPILQGQGMGRKLMDVFFNRCREKSSGKVHLGVAKSNPGAVEFYKKCGMYVIYEVEGAYMMGFDL